MHLTFAIGKAVISDQQLQLISMVPVSGPVDK